MNKQRRLIVCIFLFALFPLFVVNSVYAGDGTYSDGDPDTLSLTVLFQFDNAANFDPATEWEETFTRASQLLYNATDGQVQIGEVNFYHNCPEVRDQADILIQSGSSGAHVNRVGGLGRKGAHVFIYDRMHSQNLASARGHFGIVHELGHYVFGLFDSYEDRRGRPSSCISTTSTIASIMDGGTTIQPNNSRTEFALPRDEASCKNTEQYQIRDMVDWPWIVQFVGQEYGVNLTQPADYNTDQPEGHQDLLFNYYPCGVRTVICADESGSMSGEKINTLQEAAKLFVDLSKKGEELGVISFNEATTTVFDMTSMNFFKKTRVKNKIDGIQAGGETDIGGGLKASLDMITRQGDRNSNEAILLLSDGKHNGTTNPADILPLINEREIPVYTVGLGSDADASLLSSIADATGGSYYFAKDTSVLNAHFNSIFTEMRNDGTIAKEQEEIVAGEVQEKSFLVDKYTQAAGESRVVLSWGNGSLNLELQRPDGTVVLPDDPDVQLYLEGERSKLYRISESVAGEWTVGIESASTDTSYVLQVSSQAGSSVSVVAGTDKGEYEAGEVIQLETSVIAPPSGSLEAVPVSGVQVTGEVLLDGNFLEDITLVDDGDLSHGDQRANDGVYSATYQPLKEGNLTFRVRTVNKSGETAPPDEEWPDFEPQPVDPFQRVAETTVFVSMPPGGIKTPQPTLTPTPQSGALHFNSGRGGGLWFVAVPLALGGLFVYLVANRRRELGRSQESEVLARLSFADGRSFPIHDRFVIGRSQSCDYSISDTAVSRQHAIIRVAEGAWFIQDLDSKGGTYVNDVKVNAQKLRNGDRIKIGDTVFNFQEG